MRSFIHGVVLAGLVGSIAVASWGIRGRYDDVPLKAASDRAIYWQRAYEKRPQPVKTDTREHVSRKPAAHSRNHHHRQPGDTGEADRLNRAEAE